MLMSDEKLLRGEIAKAVLQIELHSNLNPMQKLIEKWWHGDLSVSDKMEFLKVMHDSLLEFTSKQDRQILEPNYSVIKTILNNVLKKDPTYFVKTILDDECSRLSPEQMMQAYNRSRKKLMFVLLCSQNDIALELISIIQTNWEISQTLTKFMNSLKPFLNQEDMDDFKQLTLSDEYRHIRNADSHLRIAHDCERKTVHLQDMNPKTEIIVWEKSYTYDEIMAICNDIMKWTNGFICAWQDVMSESIILAIIRNYERGLSSGNTSNDLV